MNIAVSNKPFTLETKPASQVTKLRWQDKLSRFACGTLGLNVVYHLVDVGLANLFALDILRHGTNIMSYLSINLRGADPKMGGRMEAEYKPNVGDALRAHTKNRFFVMPSISHAKDPIEALRTITGPPNFIRMATVNLVGGPKEDSALSNLIRVCTPVLRFKFRPEEVNAPRFHPDTGMQPAYYTEHSISPWHLGICGSITQGIGPGMFQRMANHPIKVLSGVAMLGGAAYVAKRTYRYVTSEPEKSSSSHVAWSASSKRIAKMAGGYVAVAALTGNRSIQSLAGYGLIGGVGYLLYRKNASEIKKEAESAEADLSTRPRSNAVDQRPVPRRLVNAKLVAKTIVGLWLIRTLMTM